VRKSVGQSSATVIAVAERPPLEPAVVERVRASFARQGAMATLGAELTGVAAGRVAIAVPVEPRLSQQHEFLHAGVVVAALDSACGYAALTLMAEDAEVLTVELKVNLLAPATGDRIVAEGEVVRAGGTLTVCRGDAYAEQRSERTHVATMLATLVRRRGGPMCPSHECTPASYKREITSPSTWTGFPPVERTSTTPFVIAGSAGR
jgi:uncharacterized protein (TIGR00369 family)